MKNSRSFVAIPPGVTIKEQLVQRSMSQKEFALRMEMSEKHISKLINGEVQLTVDMARRLELVLGLPLQFWCNLETIYREKLIKIDEENSMDSDLKVLNKFPYREMVKNGWIEDCKRREDKVNNLRKYFEVIHLDLLNERLLPNGLSCRKLTRSENDYYSFLTWIQRAKFVGRTIETETIDLKLLNKYLVDIRKMTRTPADEFCEKLRTMLASCGIALVFLPHPSGSFLHGVTFYDGNKIVLGLTVRGRDADKFWFSLFHELGHIMLGHINKQDGASLEDEKEADLFASNTLISEDSFSKFIDNNDFSEMSIKEFADQEDIDSGIVLGRLQKYEYVPYGRYEHLKKKYSIV